jgi:hypothetical protein
MRERIYEGGVDREHWVEEMREANSIRFRHQSEERTIAVEAPRSAGFRDV